MAKYTVYATVRHTYDLTVDADHEEDAIEKVEANIRELIAQAEPSDTDWDPDDWSADETPEDNQARASQGFDVMDPTETLRLLLQALVDADRQQAQAHALNLHDWLSHRGFIPSAADVARVCAEFA